MLLKIFFHILIHNNKKSANNHFISHLILDIGESLIVSHLIKKKVIPISHLINYLKKTHRSNEVSLSPSFSRHLGMKRLRPHGMPKGIKSTLLALSSPHHVIFFKEKLHLDRDSFNHPNQY